MGTEKSLEDRFKQIEDHCDANHIELGLEFDHVDRTWVGWNGQEQLTDACDSMGELAEALESEFSL